MATETAKLTYEQFLARFGHGNTVYEFWYGEAIRKGMPTWVHGLLQQIIMRFLTQAGYIAASEVELRIDPEAHPRPDVIATKTPPEGNYPTKGLDLVVEILSEDDAYLTISQKCFKYQAWGFGAIYLVDPENRSVVKWRDGATTPCAELASVPVQQIWDALDQQYSRS